MSQFIVKIQDKFSPVFLANIAILVTMLAWGTSFISTKIAVTEIPPFTLALIRFSLTSVILYSIIRKTEPQTTMSRVNGYKIALAGFFGISLYFCLENSGIKLTTASNASLIISVNPILCIALNMVFFRARLSLLEMLGIGIGLSGAYLTVTANGNIDFSSDNFKGNLYMIGAMIAWAFYTVLSKHLQTKYSGIFIVTYQTLFATLFLVPFALLEYDQWQIFSFSALAQIIYLAVICSALGYFLYVYALKALDVVVTTLYLNLVPIIGVISGYFILGEQILMIQLIGGAITIFAIFIANLDRTLNFFKHRTQTIAKKNK